MGKLVELDARDVELLDRGQWDAPATCARSRRLAKLRLAEAVQGTFAPSFPAKPGHWRTTDKGRLALKHHQRSRLIVS